MAETTLSGAFTYHEGNANLPGGFTYYEGDNKTAYLQGGFTYVVEGLLEGGFTYIKTQRPKFFTFMID